MDPRNKNVYITFFGTVFVQLCIFVFCVAGVSQIIFSTIRDICPQWIWREQVALFIQLFKKPFSQTFYENEQVFSNIAGSILVAIPLISVACAFIIGGFLYFKLFYFLESIEEKSGKSNTLTEAQP